MLLTFSRLVTCYMTIWGICLAISFFVPDITVDYRLLMRLQMRNLEWIKFPFTFHPFSFKSGHNKILFFAIINTKQHLKIWVVYFFIFFLILGERLEIPRPYRYSRLFVNKCHNFIQEWFSKLHIAKRIITWSSCQSVVRAFCQYRANSSCV